MYFDIKENRIPNALIAAGILSILAGKLLQIGAYGFQHVAWSIVNGVAGFTFIWLLYSISNGKIGLGDAKLSALISLALGMIGWMFALFVASLTGLLFVLVMIHRGKMSRDDSIPFAPFLSLGSVCSIFTNQFIISLFETKVLS